MKLYELTGLWLELYQADEEDLGFDTLFDTLEQLELQIQDKLEGAGLVLKQLNADIVAFKAEEKNLRERRQTLENNAERLKNYILKSMQFTGVKKIDTPKIRLSYSDGRESVKIHDAEALMQIEEIWKPYSYSEGNINKTLLKELLEQQKIDGAEIVRNPSLRIK